MTRRKPTFSALFLWKIAQHRPPDYTWRWNPIIGRVSPAYVERKIYLTVDVNQLVKITSDLSRHLP
jgi:hypothetical protein